MNIAIFREQYTSGSAGPTGTSSSKNTRILNTSVSNGISGLSLDASTGVISFPAGTFHLKGLAISYLYSSGQLQFIDSDNSTTLDSGISTAADPATAYSQSVVMPGIDSVLTFASSTDVILSHYVGPPNSGINSPTLGNPVSSGQPEVYAQLTIIQL